MMKLTRPKRQYGRSEQSFASYIRICVEEVIKIQMDKYLVLKFIGGTKTAGAEARRRAQVWSSIGEDRTRLAKGLCYIFYFSEMQGFTHHIYNTTVKEELEGLEDDDMQFAWWAVARATIWWPTTRRIKIKRSVIAESVLLRTKNAEFGVPNCSV
jgi:hypothetical protein